jgi:hypothetical protein
MIVMNWKGNEAINEETVNTPAKGIKRNGHTGQVDGY